MASRQGGNRFGGIQGAVRPRGIRGSGVGVFGGKIRRERLVCEHGISGVQSWMSTQIVWMPLPPHKPRQSLQFRQ
jgi:hypothetical protein